VYIFIHRYRLAPEYPYPAPTNDCKSVLDYVIANPKEFNIDLKRLVFAGDSAGK
jgi:acetyl esterase/lipase